MFGGASLGPRHAVSQGSGGNVQLLTGLSSSKWCTASLVKTVLFLCALLRPSTNKSCFVGGYLKPGPGKGFMGFYA